VIYIIPGLTILLWG